MNFQSQDFEKLPPPPPAPELRDCVDKTGATAGNTMFKKLTRYCS